MHHASAIPAVSLPQVFRNGVGLAINTSSKIGEGAYGIVYPAVATAAAADVAAAAVDVAVKRNVIDSTVFGIGSLREADTLTRIKGHPFVVGLCGFIVDDGGKKNGLLWNGSGLGKNFSPTKMKDDVIHFVMDLEQTSLEKVIRMKKSLCASLLPPRTIKIIAAQILLGLEWIHKRGIIHRDIKPGNVLYNRNTQHPQIRLCDFNLCGIPVNTQSNTLYSPGLVTSWYRPPEICFEQAYTEKVDVWSTGLVLFELVSRNALLHGVRDNAVSILSALFRKIPEIASRETIQQVAGDKFDLIADEMMTKLSMDAKFSIINTGLSQTERRKQISRRIRTCLDLSASTAIQFSNSDGGCNAAAAGGTIDQFCDMITRMLDFDPRTRCSISDALNHPFFDWLRPYIQQTRNDYLLLPSTPPLPPAAVLSALTTPDPERECAILLSRELWNHRASIPWYSHRILFHSIDAFDRYLAHSRRGGSSGSSSGGSVVMADASGGSSGGAYLKFYMLCYMFYKYFATLDIVDTWDSFAPREYTTTSQCRNAARKFELDFFLNVCHGSIYRETIYEAMARRDGRVHESTVRECLAKYDLTTVIGIDSLLATTSSSSSDHVLSYVLSR